MASSTGTARGTMQGSCRPSTVISTGSPRTFTVRWRRAIEGAAGWRSALEAFAGRDAPRHAPIFVGARRPAPVGVELVVVVQLPRRRAAVKSAPISKPRTAPTLITACARRASSLSNTGSPRPAGTPSASTS